MKLRILIGLALLAGVAPAHAEVAISGDFKAEQACSAVQSIRTGANPGDVRLEPGHSYPLIAKNRPDVTHYLVAVDGASPRQRWVEAGCGQVSAATGTTPAEQGHETHLLVLSWEPQFCEDHGDKSECQRETEQSFEASHFSLHGLWPQPKTNVYCGVDSGLKDADGRSHWFDLPDPGLTPATNSRLAEVMPGVLSGLERHEWIKHGTCFHAEPEAYFQRAIGFIGEVNGSAAQKLFAQRIGQTVTSDEIRAAFNQSFGEGAGERVEIHCQNNSGGREISEVWLHLAGDVNGAAPLAELLRAAPTTAADCPGGKVAEPRG